MTVSKSMSVSFLLRRESYADLICVQGGRCDRRGNRLNP